MAPTPSVLIKIQFTFRDAPRIFTTRVHFNGGTPADTAHWNTLFDNIVAELKNDIYAGSEIVEVVGYTAASDVAVAQKSYTQAGLIPLATGDHYTPGEAVALLRWSTPARTSKNHPIYLFNYFHGVAASSGEPDKPSNDIKSGITNFANFLQGSGFTDGVNVYTRAGPNGVTAGAHQVDTYLTHRDFPR